MRYSKNLILLLIVCLAVSCQNRQPDATPVLSEAQRELVYQEDEKLLAQIKLQNSSLGHDFQAFNSAGGWRKRGYFSAQESDQLESLLFRYHAAHAGLLEITNRYAKVEAGGAGEELRISGHRELLAQAQFAVDTFSDDAIAIKKLNQSFPRSEIPTHTYDNLVKLLKSSRLRKVESIGQDIDDRFSKSSYEIQAKVFMRVSRFKSPRAHLIHFSDSQKEMVCEMLEPGDILVSYTSGYASSIFIPGVFKHAMVYVGSVEDRQRIGLSSSRVKLPGGASAQRERTKNFQEDKTREMLPANVIEAVGEGVKFSNLNHLLDTHINRLAVIRPRLTGRQRILYLSRVFSYLGQDYDFEFDFADASRQVCTELVYRALNGVDGIEFDLSYHAGRLAMTADNMINYCFQENPDAFGFVLLAKESAMSVKHSAKIMTGEKGERELKRLMEL